MADAAALRLEAPIAFGRYELVRRIGKGGMGEVFLARERIAGTSRAMVVKKILPHLANNRHFVARFLDEAKVVVRLAHPNIAALYEMGEVEGQYFLAMEYVEGKTVSRLAKRLRELKQAFPLGEALLLAEHVCEGLAYAHEAKDLEGQPLRLVHRDMSPGNVCISYSGKVKIIDFGAAQSSLKEEMTAPGVVIGNLSYMAPEQARKGQVGPAADVYSLGAVLWELLTGRSLSSKAEPVERWRRAASPSWEPPSWVRRNLSESIDDVVMRALRTDPRERHESAVAFRDALFALRRRVAPQATEASLGRLLSKTFAKEKRAEEQLLRALLASPRSEDWDDEETVLAPPTFYAFEHQGVAEEGFESQTSTESRVGENLSLSIVPVGFGVPIGARGSAGEEMLESATAYLGTHNIPWRGMAVALGTAALLTFILWWGLSQ